MKCRSQESNKKAVCARVSFISTCSLISLEILKTAVLCISVLGTYIIPRGRTEGKDIMCEPHEAKFVVNSRSSYVEIVRGAIRVYEMVQVAATTARAI